MSSQFSIGGRCSQGDVQSLKQSGQFCPLLLASWALERVENALLVHASIAFSPPPHHLTVKTRKIACIACSVIVCVVKILSFPSRTVRCCVWLQTWASFTPFCWPIVSSETSSLQQKFLLFHHCRAEAFIHHVTELSNFISLGAPTQSKSSLVFIIITTSDSLSQLHPATQPVIT